MSRFTRRALALLVVSAGLQAFGQATVNENQTYKVYVSPSGKDTNPGTQTAPFKTIGRAVAQASSEAYNNVGTKIEVEPGTYREYVKVTGTRYSPTLTIEAVTPGTATVSGADLYTGWTSSGGHYTHYFAGLPAVAVPSGWPTTYPAIIYRREVVLFNHEMLTQVTSSAALAAGTFWVDDANHQIELIPPAGAPMTGAIIEVGNRPHILDIESRNNVALRGLTFEGGTSALNDSSVNVDGSTNVLVDKITLKHINFGGFHSGTSNYITVQNSYAHDNGGEGFGAYKLRHGLFQFDESDYNNWRGAAGGFYDFGMGGFKFFKSHGVDVKQVFAYNNKAQGLWFDTDNRQIAVDGAVLVGNLVDNLQVELNEGPISIANSTLCYGQVGTYLVNSANVTYSGNTFYSNGGNTTHTWPQFYFSGKPGGRNFTDWETGIYYNVISNHITFAGNKFIDTTSAQEPFDTFQTGTDWTAFQTTFHSSGNTWFNPARTAVFYTSAGKKTLSQWQSYTGQDKDAVWSSIAAPSACTVPTSAINRK